MVNQQLLDYIRISEAHGHLPSQVYNRLISQGWNPKEISETMKLVYPLGFQNNQQGPATAQKVDGRAFNKWQNQLTKYSIYDTVKAPVKLEEQPLPPPPKAPNPIFTKTYKIGGIVLLVILAIIAAYILTRPSCGNGLVESFENSDNCCIDTGCPKGQTCENNMCEISPCGDCQYLEGTVCKDYDCCAPEDCFSDERCSNHVCEKVTCGPCQYVSAGICTDYECCETSECADDESCQNHVCTKIPCGPCQGVVDKKCTPYGCCSDADCNDNNPESVDECKNPSSFISYCKNEIPPKCFRHEDCDDGDWSTIDVCAGQPRRCWNLECKDNEDCDDEDNSTKDICAGKPGGKCYNPPIRMCRDADGYCPWTCDYINDNECPLKTIDCRDDIDCMIDASEICGPAIMLITERQDVNGVITSTSTLNAINGKVSRKCEFVQRIQNISLSYTDEKVQRMLDDNIPYGDILHDELEERRIAQEDEGQGLRCLFSISELSGMLERWDDDIFSASDLASCEETEVVICTNLKLDINESTDIGGIWIELLDIVNNSIVISVDGLTSTIPHGMERMVNGLKVMNDGYDNITASMKINCDKCVTGDDYCPSTCRYAFDKDCERIYEECNDMECMIDATEGCIPSELERRDREDYSGVIFDTDFVDTIGDEGSACIYTSTIEENNAEFSDELVQSKLDSGMTQAEIVLEEELENLRASVDIDSVLECSFLNTEQLVVVLEKIDNGTLVTLVDCEPGSTPTCSVPPGWTSYSCTATPLECAPVFLEVSVSFYDAGRTIIVTGITGDLVDLSVNGATASINVGEYQVISGLKVEVIEIHMNLYVELELNC